MAEKRDIKSHAGYAHGDTEATMRLPSWLRRPVPAPGSHATVEKLLDTLQLNTVCQSAQCPNRGECFASGTSTFLIMGETCTRGCRFCAVETKKPLPLDPTEPGRVARAVREMGLSHVVITSVTRDDLPDGGADHFAETIQAVRTACPETTIEVLTSDFAGDLRAVETVVDAQPNVFNHNIETVSSLYTSVRPGARYKRSLDVLRRAHEYAPAIPVKSGLMLGLGEEPTEVIRVMSDLREAGVTLLTLGQYLRPSAQHLPVARFVEPEEFARYEREAYALGFAGVVSAPFVRSSYHAKEMQERLQTGS